MRYCQRLIAFVRRRYRMLLVLAVLLALLGDIATHWGTCFWAKYRLHAARTALERQDYGRASELLTQLLRLRPDDAEIHFLSARLARRSGDLAEAARQLRACEKLASLPKEELKLEQMLTQAQEGDLSPSQEQVLHQCIAQQHPDTFLILEALSQGYTKRYQLSQALDCLNRMLQQQPDNPYALTRRGWIQERFGNLQEAQADFRRAVAVAPEYVLARRFLADHLLHLVRKPEEAAEHYEFLHQRQPDDPELTANLARCWLGLDQVAEARSLLGKALVAHPRDANLLLVRGLVALNEGQLPQAENWLRQAVASKPAFQPAYYSLILVLQREGKLDEVEKCRARLEEAEADLAKIDKLTQQIKQEPYNSQLRYEMARMLFKIGEDQEGENWLQKVLLLDPNHQLARQALAEHQQKGANPSRSPMRLDPQGPSTGLTRP
jgi:tetratricopeptide (TPR) repeat protein